MSRLSRNLALLAVRGSPWVLNMLRSRHYRHLTEGELRATRKSDTVVIFGSGSSINDLSPEEWGYFEQQDTISFNWFVYQDHVRIDYHLVREIGGNDFAPSDWRPKVAEYARVIGENPCYADAVFLVQGGWRAINGNRMIGMKLLPKEARVFRFHDRIEGVEGRLSPSFGEGLVHGPATLMDCVNFAYILGWQRIVLVGVDLYDRRYFWLQGDETRDLDRQRAASHDARHNTASAVTEMIRRWREALSEEGFKLYVYNPRSLLADVLPVFDRREVISR